MCKTPRLVRCMHGPFAAVADEPKILGSILLTHRLLLTHRTTYSTSLPVSVRSSKPGGDSCLLITMCAVARASSYSSKSISNRGIYPSGSQKRRVFGTARTVTLSPKLASEGCIVYGKKRIQTHAFSQPLLEFGSKIRWRIHAYPSSN